MKRLLQAMVHRLHVNLGTIVGSLLLAMESVAVQSATQSNTVSGHTHLTALATARGVSQSASNGTAF